MSNIVLIYVLKVCPRCIRVEKRSRGKKKPWAVVEAVDPSEVTSMNVCKLKKTKAEDGPVENKTFTGRAEEEGQ